ncbi:MAG: YifB family Mg chelatase-like AAA ATPase [Nocardioidaceae bacterium]
MSLARTRSVTLDGITGNVVEIEVHVGVGLPKTVLVGLPDTALNESRDRCRAAVINSGISWPNHRITIALSPASLPKRGSHYDLAIALAVVSCMGEVPQEPIRDAVILGELALDGRLRAVPGVLPCALAAAAAGCDRAMVPEANVAEAEAVSGLQVIGVRSLRHAVALLRGGEIPDDPPVLPLASTARLTWSGSDRLDRLDLADVVGQPEGRLCVEVAAAGGHHLLFTGPPGVGKTMLAERLPALLPDLTFDESLEVSAVHSVAGTLDDEHPLVVRPPFLDPHHTASVASVVGGGSRAIRPGSMSLAHRGVLFMDEAPEFVAPVLEALRQPLESGHVTIGRADRTATFPAGFQLVLAANPCPCGSKSDDREPCECTPAARRRYRHRLSGPILDRIDIHRGIRQVSTHQLRSDLVLAEASSLVAVRVAAARERQSRRFAGLPWRRNGDVPGPDLRRDWPPTGDGAARLEQAGEQGRLSARGVTRVLRLAWTLADLKDLERPGVEQVEAALALRSDGPLPAALCPAGWVA